MYGRKIKYGTAKLCANCAFSPRTRRSKPDTTVFITIWCSKVLGDYFPLNMLKQFGGEDELNMTTLGLNLSEFQNGVAKKHGEVSRSMFPDYDIRSITNGVHTRTWTHPKFADVYDEYIPGWREEPELFVRVDNVPDQRIWDTHQAIKVRTFYRNQTAHRH